MDYGRLKPALQDSFCRLQIAIEASTIERQHDDFTAVLVVAVFFAFLDVQDGQRHVRDVAVFDEDAGAFVFVPVVDRGFPLGSVCLFVRGMDGPHMILLRNTAHGRAARATNFRLAHCPLAMSVPDPLIRL